MFVPRLQLGVLWSFFDFGTVSEVSSFVSSSEGKLWVLWRLGGQIGLDFTSAAAVDGERGSGGCRGRGVSPVDGLQPTAISAATPSKARVRWGLGSSR